MVMEKHTRDGTDTFVEYGPAALGINGANVKGDGVVVVGTKVDIRGFEIGGLTIVTDVTGTSAAGVYKVTAIGYNADGTVAMTKAVDVAVALQSEIQATGRASLFTNGTCTFEDDVSLGTIGATATLNILLTCPVIAFTTTNTTEGVSTTETCSLYLQFVRRGVK